MPDTDVFRMRENEAGVPLFSLNDRERALRLALEPAASPAAYEREKHMHFHPAKKILRRSEHRSGASNLVLPKHWFQSALKMSRTHLVSGLEGSSGDCEELALRQVRTFRFHHISIDEVFGLPAEEGLFNAGNDRRVSPRPMEIADGTPDEIFGMARCPRLRCKVVNFGRGCRGFPRAIDRKSQTLSLDDWNGILNMCPGVRAPSNCSI
jgi:hypothetical protein